MTYAYKRPAINTTVSPAKKLENNKSNDLKKLLYGRMGYTAHF